MVNCQSQHDRTFVALVDPTGRFAIKLPVAMKHLDVTQNAGRITRSKVDRAVAVRLAPDPMREDLRPIAEGTELSFTHSRLHDDETPSSHKDGCNGALDKLESHFNDMKRASHGTA